MPEKEQDYNVSITDVVWRGKPEVVRLRTPEGKSLVFKRDEDKPQKLSLSEYRAQELRGNGYLVDPVKAPKPPKDSKPPQEDKPEGKE